MYKPHEIQASVEKLVRGSIRRPIDPLGVRRVDVVYSDIQEAGASVLLLQTASPFYCLALGAQRLRDAVSEEAAVLDQLLAAILATGRRVLPIPSVDMLFGAKAALEELETASAGRSQGFKDISKVPSYQRFSLSIQAFLDGPAQNVKSNGKVVETPQEARQAIPGLLRQLAAAHTELRRRVALLANGIEDFTQLNLPALVATGAISRAREVIAGHATKLEGQSAEERLLSLKEVTLDVLATKAVVTQFGSFSGPSTFYRVLGTGGPFADASHEAFPASTFSDSYDAIILASAARVFFDAIDRRAGTPLTLDLSPMASCSSSSSSSVFGGWIIGDGLLPALSSGAPAPNNNQLRIEVASTDFPTSIYEVALSLSPDGYSPRTADQICEDLNYASFLPSNVRAEGFFAQLAYSGPFDINHTPTATTFHVPAGASDLVNLGVQVGHLVHVLEGPNAKLYPITAVTATTLTVAGTLVVETGRNCEVGSPARRIRIRCTDPAVQIPRRERITVRADTVKSLNACSDLGFFPNISSTCRPTTMEEVVAQINGRQNELVASTLFTPVVEGEATSNPTNSFSVTFTEPVGIVTEYMTVRITSGQNQGDYLVDRPGALPNELLLKSTLPVHRAGIDPVTFTASLGHKRLVLAGKSKGLSAELSLDGPAAPVFFTTVPKVSYGTTPYFQLPEMPRGLQPGDTLELYETDYAHALSTHVISKVESGLNVLTLDPPLSTHVEPGHWVFGDQPPPFARLRVAKTYDFTVLRDRLLAWLALGPNQLAYFTDLNRQVNPLLVNESPTAAAVGSATASVEALYASLTEAAATSADPTLTLDYALRKYQVPPVPAVDVLLKTFKEKGSDRAVDLLLAGEFSTFFGLSIDEASYAGAMQSAMREVAREDIAVRRTNRADASAPRQLAEAPSPDYEYNQSDIEGGAQVDPP